MGPGIDRFIAELRAGTFAPFADQYKRAFETLDRQGDGDAAAVNMLDAMEWIASQDRSTYEMIVAMNRLVDLPKGATVNLGDLFPVRTHHGL